MIDRDLIALYERLAGTGLPAMVVGAVAAASYGEARSTLDIDIVVAAGPADAERIAAAFTDERFYVPPIETIQRELSRGARGSFNILDSRSGLKADVYPAGGDELMAYGLANRTIIDLDGVAVALAPATYVVAMKLRFFALSRQDKHLRDIRSILAASGS